MTSHPLILRFFAMPLQCHDHPVRRARAEFVIKTHPKEHVFFWQVKQHIWNRLAKNYPNKPPPPPLPLLSLKQPGTPIGARKSSPEVGPYRTTFEGEPRHLLILIGSIDGRIGVPDGVGGSPSAATGRDGANLHGSREVSTKWAWGDEPIRGSIRDSVVVWRVKLIGHKDAP